MYGWETPHRLRFYERSKIMNFDLAKEVWEEIVAFFDRLMGWLNYVAGDADDPYGYDDFWPFPWQKKS